jgi:NAD(P)-dependent dehydrogenase (short-subunit alcohol dehydrogenase family)
VQLKEERRKVLIAQYYFRTNPVFETASFGRTIAKELTPRGIRVNTISPGPIITPILDKGGNTPAQKDSFIEGPRLASHSAVPAPSPSRRSSPLPRR